MIEGKTKIIEDFEYPIDTTPLMSGELPEHFDCVRIITKDSLTANDGGIQANLSVAKDKTTQNCNVMAYLESKGFPLAFERRHDETSFIAKKCEMLPFEFVARRKPYGSYLKREPLAPGVNAWGAFDPPIVEMFHKHTVVMPCLTHKNQHAINPETRLMPEAQAREYFMVDGEWTHEVYTDPLLVIEQGVPKLYPSKQPRHDMQPLMTIKLKLSITRHFDAIAEKTAAVFERIEEAWKKLDVKLIDLKVEWGKVKMKETSLIVIADVIDNDSWRIWPNGDPKQQLDKQAFRDGEELTEIQKKYAIVTEYTNKF